MKILLGHPPAALHADPPVSYIDDFPDVTPIRLHEEIAEASGAAESMPVVKRARAAHAAKHSSFGISSFWESFLV
ncbi:MAG: hypothetical protein J5838_02575 [Desulfovibrio sp.]|nr:hypothetical protein [Desulfovibrio sp.]